MRESAIEKAVTDLAKGHGWLSFKFTSPAHRGVPDRLYIRDGITIYIEFKQKGKKPNKLQEATMKKMQQHGAMVWVIDSVDKGAELFCMLDIDL